MIKSGKDKLGNYWYVESSQPVEVKVCEACGNPVAIINASASQPVQKIRFIKPLSGQKEILIGEIPLEVIEEHIKNHPIQCTWCGTKVTSS